MTLRRVLGVGDAAWLVAGNMIGAGIFITPGFVAAGLPGVAGPMLAWVLGGLLALAGAAVYGELGTRMPEAGGDYRYLVRAFGPVWGFLMGWSAMLLTFSAAAAAMCKVSTGYLVTALGLAGPAAETVGVVAPALLVLAMTGANVAGARIAGRTTTLLTALPLLCLCGMFAYGLVAGRAGEAAGWPARSLAWPSGAWPLALGSAMVPVFFTYSGWNAAAYVAGEVRDPGRNLPRALLWGTAAVTLLYLAVNLVLLAVLGDDLAGSSTSGADAARRLLGPAAGRALAAIIAVAVMGSANVTLMAGARIYYAMAVDRLAPHALASTGRRGVPTTALWCGGAWSAALTFLAGVDRLVSWATLAILLLSSLTVVALFVLRRRGPAAVAFRCPGYPWTPAIYLLASLGVAVSSGFYDPLGSLWGVLLVATGFPVYLVASRFAAGGRAG